MGQKSIFVQVPEMMASYSVAMIICAIPWSNTICTYMETSGCNCQQYSWLWQLYVCASTVWTAMIEGLQSQSCENCKWHLEAQ